MTEREKPARRRKRPLPLVFTSLVLVALPLHAAKLAVEIHGISGEMLDNARLLLTIRDDAGDHAPPPARLRPLFEQGKHEIEQALEPFGYYRSRVDGSFDQRPDGSWLARYDVNPGPPLDVASADIELHGPGADDPAFARLAREFPLQSGDVLDQRLWSQGKDAISAYAARLGYFDARYDSSQIRIDLARYRATLELRMATGERYRFGPIRLHETALDPQLLESYAMFRPGEPFRSDQVLQYENALGGSGYFDSVEVRPLPDEAKNREVPVVVDLRLARLHKWQVGGGYGTDTGPRVTLALDLRRLNRHGHRAHLEARASAIERALETRYEIPGANARTELWTIESGWDDLAPSTSHSQGTHVGAHFEHLLGSWKQTTGLGFQNVLFEIGPDRGRALLVVPDAGWSRTRVDDQLYPLHGDRLELRLDGASSAVLSDASFIRAYAAGRIVHQIGGGNLRLLARAEVGATRSSDFHGLPPTFRWFAGGDRSVRGYGYQELTPRTAAGEPLGGQRLATASLELDDLFLDRWGQRFGAALFFDAGNAMRTFSGPYDKGTGVGLRWLSPVGMVRADMAWALDRPGDPIRIHLSIGSYL